MLNVKRVISVVSLSFLSFGSFASDCGTSSMTLRGSFNGFNTLKMQCNESGEWYADNIEFSMATGNRFKFDVLGDWSQNYGDSTVPDGIADLSGKDISVNPGTYNIKFNVKTKRYSSSAVIPVEKQHYTAVEMNVILMQLGDRLAKQEASPLISTFAKTGDCTLLPAPGVNYAGCDFTQKNPFPIGTMLGGVDLSGANLNGANFTGFYFGSAKFDGASMIGMQCEGCYFGGASLVNVDARHAYFKRVMLGGANMTYSNFKGATISGHLVRAKLSSSIFVGATMLNVDMNVVEAIGSDFSGATMSGGVIGGNFSYAKLPMLNLKQLALYDAVFDYADMSFSNFTGSSLIGNSFKATNLMGANFENAKLENVVFESALIKGANFKGANCYFYDNADFNRCPNITQ